MSIGRYKKVIQVKNKAIIAVHFLLTFCPLRSMNKVRPSLTSLSQAVQWGRKKERMQPHSVPCILCYKCAHLNGSRQNTLYSLLILSNCILPGQVEIRHAAGQTRHTACSLRPLPFFSMPGSSRIFKTDLAGKRDQPVLN